MSNEMKADQLFAAIRIMRNEGIINQGQHDYLQGEIDKWIERQMVDESQVYGNGCLNGNCHF